MSDHRTSDDVWDDRMRMVGAILIALSLIYGALMLAVIGPLYQIADIVAGGFIASIPTAVRYFMQAKTNGH